MTPTEIIVKARAIISKGWCQGASARTEAGILCNPHNPLAVRWCLSGALRAAATPDGADAALDIVADALEYHEGTLDIIGWNDQAGRTQADVLALLDAAIPTPTPTEEPF